MNTAAIRPLTLAGFALLALSANALAQTCVSEAGGEQAELYVDHCLEVSPATRPPCNVENPCELIISEIVRGCDMLAGDAPEFCDEYGG